MTECESESYAGRVRIVVTCNLFRDTCGREHMQKPAGAIRRIANDGTVHGLEADANPSQTCLPFEQLNTDGIDKYFLKK